MKSVALALLSFSTGAVAYEAEGISLRVAPSAPAADVPFALEVAASIPCIVAPADSAVIDLEARTIRYYLLEADTAPPCGTANTVSKSVPIPGLPRARYTVEWGLCSEGVPPPGPTCRALATEELIVGGAPRAVPTLTRASIALAALALLLAALIAKRKPAR